MNDSHFMLSAIELAKKGLGSVSPNPLVGCVIVKDNVIVAEGYHQTYGEAHAEINAIANLPKTLNPTECTLYVNLEPCCHHGKTPPCADLIIEKGFKKVVICNFDPNPLVAGKGIEKLTQAGIEVITCICKAEGRFLNRNFFTFHEKKRPYIILKWAQTADGFISKFPVPAHKHENWITGHDAQKYVHQMRAETDAILVGKNTVLADNPELTTRLVKGKNAIRIILSKNPEFNLSAKIFNAASKTIIFNASEEKTIGNINWVKLNFDKNVLTQLLAHLTKQGVSSLVVEGGLSILESFINEGLWDEANIFVNPNLNFETGILAPKIVLNTDYQCFGADRLFVLYSDKGIK